MDDPLSAVQQYSINSWKKYSSTLPTGGVTRPYHSSLIFSSLSAFLPLLCSESPSSFVNKIPFCDLIQKVTWESRNRSICDPIGAQVNWSQKNQRESSKTMTMSPEEEDAWCRNNSGSWIQNVRSLSLLKGVLPSLEEIQEGLGTWAIVLYSVSATTTVILLLQFVVLIRYIKRITRNITICDQQAVHHVRWGSKVEKHHLGKFRLCRPLRFQPCKEWWCW